MSKLRLAKPEDWSLVLLFRNQSYKYFEKQTKPLSWKEHEKYLKAHPELIHYFYDDKVYIKINGSDIGIITDRFHRNKGIAKRALKEVYKIHKNLFAKIHIKNTKSFKLFFEASK